MQHFYLLGHVIDNIPELPLVVTDKVQELTKTKQAVGFLRRIRAWPDVQKVCNRYDNPFALTMSTQ